MGATSVDSSNWPLVRIRIDGRQSDDDVDQLLADFAALLRRGEPYLALAEVREYTADFDHAKRVARWTLDHADEVRSHIAAAALVIPSDLFRLMLSTFALVTPMPCPFLATKDGDEALAWLREQAKQLEFPSAL